MSYDAFGHALADWYAAETDEPLFLNNSYGEPERMPVEIFFREEADLTDLEQFALTLVKGKILDAGAGAGAHGLIFQDMGLEVVAVEMSAMACKVMKKRGVEKVIQGDILSFQGEKFDTIWLMMNGIGLVGRLESLLPTLKHLRTLLDGNGRIIMDSSDIRYLYDNDVPEDRYFGEIDYQHVYKGKTGEWFSWLFIDKRMLEYFAVLAGFTCDIVFENNEDQYLAVLTPI